MGQTTAALAQFVGFYAQRFMEWHGLEIFDGHFRGDRDDVTEFVELAHGIVEDGSDDAAVAVSGRASVTFSEAEFTGEALPCLSELEAHAVGIVVSAGEAEVLLEG